jgi:hypothetical protein
VFNEIIIHCHVCQIVFIGCQSCSSANAAISRRRQRVGFMGLVGNLLCATACGFFARQRLIGF